MSNIYSGYSGIVWQTVYNALIQYNAQLEAAAQAASGAPTLEMITALSEAMGQTLLNGTEAINTNAIAQAWNIEYNFLQDIQALPLSVSPVAAELFNNRVNAYLLASQALAPLVPQPPYLGYPNFATGGPGIPSSGLLEFYAAFDFEEEPIGLTVDTIIANAQAVADAFLEIANAILSFQGASVTQLYDVALREYECATVVVQILQGLTSQGPFAADSLVLNSWNQIVTLPAMGMSAGLINGAPFSFPNQQNMVLKNAMLQSNFQIDTLLLILRQPGTSQISLTTLRNNESLMDVAARTLGNFELWTEIASLNGLVPPYVGAKPSPGIAGYGTQILLPTPGTSIASVGTLPSYSINFLGVDLYIGPINGAMPPWRGDFQVITGYANLSWALGRRIQTVLGALVYHSNYGSRIPPEVGQVQTLETAQNINAYGQSAITTDPRVLSCISSTATIGETGLVIFQASVQPRGFANTPIAVNEVLQPQ